MFVSLECTKCESHLPKVIPLFCFFFYFSFVVSFFNLPSKVSEEEEEEVEVEVEVEVEEDQARRTR